MHDESQIKCRLCGINHAPARIHAHAAHSPPIDHTSEVGSCPRLCPCPLAPRLRLCTASAPAPPARSAPPLPSLTPFPLPAASMHHEARARAPDADENGVRDAGHGLGPRPASRGVRRQRQVEGRRKPRTNPATNRPSESSDSPRPRPRPPPRGTPRRRGLRAAAAAGACDAGAAMIMSRVSAAAAAGDHSRMMSVAWFVAGGGVDLRLNGRGGGPATKRASCGMPQKKGQYCGQSIFGGVLSCVSCSL